MHIEFEKFKRGLNYKCPVCKKDFSVEDRYCSNCKTDLYNIFVNKIKSQVKFIKTIAEPFPWKIWEILISLLVYVIFIMSFNKYVWDFYFNLKINTNVYLLIHYIIYTAANLLLFILPYYFISIKRNLSIYILGINKFTRTYNDYYLTVLSVLIFALPLIIIVKFHKLYSGYISDTYFMIFEVGNNLFYYFLIFLNFLVLEPIVTEVFFRGFFYNKLRIKFYYITSAVIVSIFYSLLIGNMLFYFSFFFLSLFFCINSDNKFSIRNNIEIKMFLNLFLLIIFFNKFYILLKIPFISILSGTVFIYGIILLIELYKVKHRKYSVLKLFTPVKYYFIISFTLIFSFTVGYAYSSKYFEGIKIRDYYYSHSLAGTISYFEEKEELSDRTKILLAGLYYEDGQFEKSLTLVDDLQKRLSEENVLQLNNLKALNYSELGTNIDGAFKLIQSLYNKDKQPGYYETIGLALL